MLKNKPVILDLRYKGCLDPKYSKLFNKTANENRNIFTKLIERLSRGNEYNLDWWASGPASRNIYTSPLFHYCCSLVFIEKLIESGESFNEIQTDSKALSNILEVELHDRDDISVVCTSNSFLRLKNIIYAVYYIISTPIYFLSNHIAALFTKGLSKPIPNNPLTLIDTFVVQLNYNDRYYPGLWDALTELEKKTVYFVPTLLQQKLISINTYKFLRKSDVNYLLKEDYLCIHDYWYAWKYWIRVLKIKVKKTSLSGYDIAPLVREELIRFDGYFSAFLAILNYSFVKRLKVNGIELRLVIDWFENQVIDKGLNAGLNKYYPNLKNKGYQGFVISKHHLCLYPTDLEQKLGLIPDEILVIGQGLINQVKEFCPNNNNVYVSVAPAFRFKSVWDKRQQYPGKSKFTVLISLSIVLDETKRIMNVLSELLEKNEIDGIRFRLKIHPATPTNKIMKLLSNKLYHRLKIVEGDFNYFLEEANLVITSGSSTLSLNAIVKGVPAIIVTGTNGLIHNPVPPIVNNKMWKLCFNAEEVFQAINYYQYKGFDSDVENIEIGKTIRSQFFESVTRKGVLKLLDIEEYNEIQAN